MKEEYYNQSIVRAMQVLSIIAKEEKGLTLAEVSKATGLHKSIAFRIVATLESGGFLSRGADGNRYHIGLKVLSLSNHALDHVSFKETLAPYMKELLELTGETVVLVMYSDLRAICIEKFEAETSVRISAQVGKSFPLHAGATGLSVLMGMPDAMVGDILCVRPLKRYSPRTVVEPEAVKAMLATARRQGYVTSDSTVDADTLAFGIPISFPQEKIYLGLSVIGPGFRIDQDKARLIVDALLDLSRKLHLQ